MRIRPFALDRWLNDHLVPGSKIQFDLASSTGPHWTLRELYDLLDPGEQESIPDIELVYSQATGGEALRREIAAMQGVDPASVQVVTGASEALLIIFFLAARPGANVIVPFPAFPTIRQLPESFGLEVRSYHLRRENGYSVDLDEVKSLADGDTEIILVNSPHNPTGATLDDAGLRSLHDFAAERAVQLVVDEVYHPIYHGPATASAARLPHATVLGDFSKALCLSGLRVGWIVERDRDRLGRYEDARGYFTISNSPVCEALAALALIHRDAILDRASKVASANLKLLDAFFAEHSDRLGWVRPEGGMTAFPWLAGGGNSRAFCEAVAERGVLLAPGDCFQMPEHFRIGFGASGAGFAKALERVSGCIVNQKSRPVKA